MQVYDAPLQEMKFLLEVFGYDELTSLEKYAAYDLETAMAMLEQSAQFSTEVLLPLNRTGDQAGLKWDPDTGAVTTPEGFKEAFKQVAENGYVGLNAPEDFGGGGAPETLGVLLGEMSASTNKSLSMCSGLTHGLINALADHGSLEQKQFYLPKLSAGEWSGTMCLTEPHCGTDLGLLRTKAVPSGDRHKITGTKIWITFGEHDMTDNIVHLVLARLPDAPDGIKGISTFIVPKYIDGKLNGVKCTGLEHKMGIHASPTCVIDLEDSEGWLIGPPHKGMRVMFTMMNSARLHVGVEALALSEISYQTALAFAKDRKQSRSLDPAKQDPNSPADNIMVHPDVRRMLLNAKSTNEAMRAMAVWTSILLDVSEAATDEAQKQEAEDLVALLTPIIKSYITERSFLNISDCMQVCGGAGFTTDWSIEQYMRDERIAMIYEGTNHIQALDLVGRKLPLHGGRLMQVFSGKITALIRDSKGNDKLAEFMEPFKAVSKQLNTVTMELAGKAMEDREVAGAVASMYLNLFAMVVLSYVWIRMLQETVDKEDAFSKAKVKTARFFFKHVLPEADVFVSRIAAGKDEMMAFEIDEF